MIGSGQHDAGAKSAAANGKNRPQLFQYQWGNIPIRPHGHNKSDGSFAGHGRAHIPHKAGVIVLLKPIQQRLEWCGKTIVIDRKGQNNMLCRRKIGKEIIQIAVLAGRLMLAVAAPIAGERGCQKGVVANRLAFQSVGYVGQQAFGENTA